MIKIDKKSIWAFFIKNVLYCLLVTVLIFFELNNPEYRKTGPLPSWLLDYKLFIIIFIISIFLSYIYSVLYYKSCTFDFLENEVVSNSGVFVKKYATIPYQRIQNIRMTQTIIEGFFDLSTLVIESGGANKDSDVTIRYIKTSYAQEIRDALLKTI